MPISEDERLAMLEILSVVAGGAELMTESQYLAKKAKLREEQDDAREPSVLDGESAGLMRDIAESLRDHANRIEHALEHGYTMGTDNDK